MINCIDCKNPMEEGMFVARPLGLHGAICQVYWCKNEGFFKIKDKLTLSSTIGKTGMEQAKKYKSYICKICKNILVKYN